MIDNLMTSEEFDSSIKKNKDLKPSKPNLNKIKKPAQKTAVQTKSQSKKAETNKAEVKVKQVSNNKVEVTETNGKQKKNLNYAI